MHEDYSDIRDKIPEPPRWFDENAVPRFCEFEPRRCANIYADEAVLAEIACQGCGHLFRVAFTGSRRGETLSNEIRARTLHYGDPPNIDCCAAGPTMNSEPRRVLEYWSRFDHGCVSESGIVTNPTAYMQWARDPDLEVEIDADWCRENG